jgi:glutathione peroxidase
VPKKKAYLFVNVASKWGLTDRDYKQLVQIHKDWKDKGLEILAFPCNQFMGQEPGSA